jgi:hypothetical protein
MKFEITVSGDTTAPNDMRVMRELSALLNSTAAPSSSGSVVTSPFPSVAAASADDDEGGPPVAIAPGEVDKNGLPWDERIHSSNRKKNDDGSWRAKRGVDKNLVPTVENELRQRMAMGSQAPYGVVPAPQPMPVSVPQPAAAPQPVPVIPQPVQPPAPMPVIPTLQAPVMPQPVVTPVTAAVPVPPAPAPQPEPAPAAATVVVDFNWIMPTLQRAINAGIVDGTYIAAMVAELGVADFTALQNDNAKCFKAYEIMARDGKYIPG